MNYNSDPDLSTTLISVKYDFEGTREDDRVFLTNAKNGVTGIMAGIRGYVCCSPTIPIEDQLDFLLCDERYYNQHIRNLRKRR